MSNEMGFMLVKGTEVPAVDLRVGITLIIQWVDEY